MSRIEADHLAREAIVYVRQSTVDQVNNNVESRRRQYGLVERARQLGWADVSVIDDDLGRSGSGVSRPGFEKLLAAICEGRVGAVVSIEASRLARNGRDWHTLLEFCGLVGTLIADEDGVYDPRLPNDRLLLGMKGTMSEMELTILRQRAHEALKQKARRGELFTSVAIGYVRNHHDRIEKDPDLRVREALALVFRKFEELQSVRQVHLWFRQERILLPAVCYGAEGRGLEWKPPVYNTIHHILTNPIYAGAYAYGRSISKTRIENGRKRVTRGVRVVRSFRMGMRLGPGDAFVHQPGVQLVIVLDPQARREEALAHQANLVLHLTFLPTRRRRAGDGLDKMMRAHLEEAAVVLAILADEDRLHRRLHVVVDAARTGAPEERERPLVGVENHLLRFARIDAREHHTAVAEANVRDLHDRRHPVHHDDLVAPIELVGLARRESQRHIGARRRAAVRLDPSASVAADGVITAFVAKRP